MAKEKMKVQVYRLGWNGVEKVTIEVSKLDNDILEVDVWFFPRVGQLCINSMGNLDVCERIEKVRAKEPFKAYDIYHFKYGKVSSSTAYLVRVKKGKSFKFRGKTFYHIDENENN